MKITRMIVAAAALSMMSSAAFAATTYNSAPSVGYHYGSGNDYDPAHSAVDVGDNEIALRFHQTGQVAPASTGNTYSFALGTQPISFDWSITANDAFASPALITVKNIGSGKTVSYNPLATPNDNYIGIAGTAQNSARLNFGFLLGGDFDATKNGLYRVTLDYGAQSLSVDARLGAGVPEPATWAMMIGGFGLVGGAMRRRTTKVVFA